MTSYFATSVTLTTANTAYSLATLLTAINANFPETGREVTIQNDVAVVGTVRIGDSSLSTSVCGGSLATGTSRTYRANMSVIPLKSFFLMGSVNSMVVDVEIAQ